MYQVLKYQTKYLPKIFSDWFSVIQNIIFIEYIACCGTGSTPKYSTYSTKYLTKYSTKFSIKYSTKHPTKYQTQYSKCNAFSLF